MPRSLLPERRNGAYLARNWKFESISLQRRVRCELNLGKGGLPMRLPPGLLGASPARRGRGRAHLDRRLGCAEMRPRKDRQTKVDRRRATLPELKVTPAATYEHD